MRLISHLTTLTLISGNLWVCFSERGFQTRMHVLPPDLKATVHGALTALLFSFFSSFLPFSAR